MKHIFVVETTSQLTCEQINELASVINKYLDKNVKELGLGFVASQSNQPDDQILVVPNATRTGEPRYTEL